MPRRLGDGLGGSLDDDHDLPSKIADVRSMGRAPASISD